ncbi:alpha/beta hydrolase fold [Lucifera butyrica]|uniref:Homoserine O-acetyltransferase n=1 Tax=Lucifera butyrica TaxID=1351585 RepID=A0A498R9A9_9FIRM|nr:homoserine O-acetyltransferase [Lucifera butyrica]VBB07537.1 alpha/beta hydrolase fold [Lucifera butyrica]
MNGKENSAGPVITFFPGFKWRPALKIMQVASPDEPLHLVSGDTLTEAMVAYETYGRLAADCSNVIVVEHALTGDSHPASHQDNGEPGWWEPLLGPGRLLDTNRYFIVCANVLGGCQGSTGPASLNPATGKAYGMTFPQVTIRDMVAVQKRLLTKLGISHVMMIAGGSMGGMQALQWGVDDPDFMDSIVAIAAPGYSSAQSIAYNKAGREAIMLDPEWREGNYYGSHGPAKGLTIARTIGMVTYQSEVSMDHKFGRRTRDGYFEIENYLNHQGESLAKRFDANTYLYLLKALDLYDLAAGYPSYEEALRRIKANVLVVGIRSDILYPAYQQQELVAALTYAGVRARYAEIDTPNGHDGFLLDFHLLRPILLEFMEKLWLKKKEYWPLFRPTQLAYAGARLVSQKSREAIKYSRSG